MGLRAEIEQLPLHRFQRVLLYERLGDTRRTIELYEGILNPGYTGCTTLSRLWADGDRHGRAVAEQFAARARALETEPSSMRPVAPGKSRKPHRMSPAPQSRYRAPSTVDSGPLRDPH